jgi:hypothetical protein
MPSKTSLEVRYEFQMKIFVDILKAVKDPQTLAEELKHYEEEAQREEEDISRRNRDSSNLV